MKDIQKIKQLRQETGAGVLEVKTALEDAGGNVDEARKTLMSKVSAKAAKKEGRTASDGLVYSYIHGNGKMGSMILMACETDFVAKTDDFQKLCKEVAMQVVAGDYTSVENLLSDEYMRESNKTVKDIIEETIAKLGEKIELREFVKYCV